jgi:hypothetical protein
VTDPVARSAARLAALIAVPLAVLAGVAAFGWLSGALGDGSGPAEPPATRTAPVPTAPVELAAPELTERETVVCRAVVALLPVDLDGLVQRRVTAGPEQNAAYGDPPVTVTCGVPAVEVPPTGSVWGLSGVCWYAVEEPDGTVWTTVDREVPVQVRVPAGYEGPSQRVVPVSTTIRETVRSTDDPPSGCPA